MLCIYFIILLYFYWLGNNVHSSTFNVTFTIQNSSFWDIEPFITGAGIDYSSMSNDKEISINKTKTTNNYNSRSIIITCVINNSNSTIELCSKLACPYIL